jgi:predicted DNA-binding antitoxin AbrB/MazE fold protein
MPFVVDAVYEKGILKLDKPLPLQDNQRVKVTVQQEEPPAELTYGLLGWTGDPEVVRRIALGPEFGIQESP